LVSGLLSELSLRRLAFRRHVPDYIFANTPVRISLTLSNQKARFPSFSLKLLDITIPFLAPRTSRHVTQTFEAARRGLYRLEGIRIATCFPFGLFQKMVFYHDEAVILVCPELVPLSLPILQQLAAIGQDQGLGRRGPGMALYNLREYRPGDDSRAIHWMTTARTSRLMLKETEADDQRIVTIMLSPVAAADNAVAFERAVSIAVSLVAYFHDRDYSIRAVIGDEEINFGTGAEHYVRILRALALCKRQASGVSTIDREQGNRPKPPEAGMVIFVTAAPEGHEGVNGRAAADCIIVTDQSGESIYVTRTGLRS
jgi:uncharacterized protein (DUF58 family)